jgi:hypothetical protein
MTKNQITDKKSLEKSYLTILTKTVRLGWNIAYLYQGDRVTLGYGSTVQAALADAFASYYKQAISA